MSSVKANDENSGVIPAGKQSSSCQDIFSIDQSTGRPSILRQTENLPNKTMPKSTKVCFQTPRRDPLTKRILSPSNSIVMSSVDENNKVMESLNLDKSDILQHEPTDPPKQEPSSFSDDNMPIQSRGGYQLDFDNLDAIDPFQGSNKMILSPVKHVVEAPVETASENILQKPVAVASLDDTLPFTPSMENSLADVSADVSSRESSVVTVNVVKVSEMEEQDLCAATPDDVCASTGQQEPSGTFVEDAPLPAKGSYNLDLDNLDAINPFQTGGSKIQNSPVIQRKVPGSDPPAEERKPADAPEEEKNMPSELDVKPAEATGSELPDVRVQEGPIKLEFNFGDDGEVKRKPPPKKFGKRFADVKRKEKKPEADPKPSEEAAVKPAPSDDADVPKEKKIEADPKPSEEAAIKPAPSDDADVPVPKASYSFDFEKFDDPNFNPFGSKTAITNSPKSSNVSNVPSSILQEMTAEQTKNPEEEKPASSEGAAEMLPPAEPNPAAMGDYLALTDKDLKDEAASQNLQAQLPSAQQLQRGSLGSEEIFLPGTMFMASDFDGQIDYLEQFGSSSFKESALRKQSLFLKFDPLLRESPKKSGGPAAQLLSAAPTGLASRLNDAEKESTKTLNNDLLVPVSLNLHPADFEALIGSHHAPLSVWPLILQNLVPQFPKPAESEEAIIEVLKYSQKDLDAAIARVQAETKVKEEQWDAKFKKLQDDGQEMRKVIAEYELLIANINANQEKEREEAQKNLSKALMEKQQVSSDLNAMERSFGELFKRLEKYKEVVEGYKKNEETLKACAQDYLERMRKGEQRYQALKAHAEEKINLANQQIAEVRSKYKAELSALQVQLRREQLRIQTLETSLEQKEKEVGELTKLCDELISKVQKG
ncbi:PREDICTED: transforming acidic coiled-coil-containing protein 3 isoform X2 [Cyprinodon variegatus]|uniref:transforming acidic coiled-coil-containing protein 3 isoform X2 n=1 Tax=Cyprinodon variegatus TaxID=28743 RepID=UPI0007428470|nr:PREDICTED: transforming acidic coiled-coil-containing protein 3 isoform X2 [Cyprinodon variegatus]